MESETYILPAHWASALINDDRSGLTEADEQELDTWIAGASPGYCAGASDEQYFNHTNDAHTLACDVLEFIFHKAN